MKLEIIREHILNEERGEKGRGGGGLHVLHAHGMMTSSECIFLNCETISYILYF